MVTVKITKFHWIFSNGNVALLKPKFIKHKLNLLEKYMYYGICLCFVLSINVLL